MTALAVSHPRKSADRHYRFVLTVQFADALAAPACRIQPGCHRQALGITWDVVPGSALSENISSTPRQHVPQVACEPLSKYDGTGNSPADIFASGASQTTRSGDPPH